MAYERVNWKDYPDTDTPITAQNLNKMDEGIETLDDEIGNTDKIADIGDGTVSGAIEAIDNYTKAISLDEVLLSNKGSSKNAIKFGRNSAGQYGYYKAGADTLIPFKFPQGTKTITANGNYNIEDFQNAIVNVQDMRIDGVLVGSIYNFLDSQGYITAGRKIVVACAIRVAAGGASDHEYAYGYLKDGVWIHGGNSAVDPYTDAILVAPNKVLFTRTGPAYVQVYYQN